MDRSRYRGYADANVYVDRTSATMAQNYVAAFIAFATTAKAQEGEESCAEIMEFMKSALPTDRLQPSENILTAISIVCGPP